jgi:sugar/nucleoside kinase (ribokinase family)
VHEELKLITSLDLTLPDASQPSGQAAWKIILHRTLPYVDIFIPSIEEIMFMLRRADFEAWGVDLLDNVTAPYLDLLAQELLASGVGIVGFKLGERGMYLRTSANEKRLAFLNRLNQDSTKWVNQAVWHPAFQVAVVGTTGAGDSAYAGFLSALLRGLDYADCVKWACAVGACNVEASDATSGVRTWEDTAHRLAAGWETYTQ